MKRAALIIALCSLPLLVMGGCGWFGIVSSEDYAQAQADAERLAGQIETRDMNLAELTKELEVAVAANDPMTVTQLVEAIKVQTNANSADNAAMAAALGTMDNSDGGWDLLQTAAGAVTTMLVGTPIGAAVVGGVRKRSAAVVLEATELTSAATKLYEGTLGDFNGLIGAFAAGGGPKNVQATRDFMKHHPGLKDRVTDRRVEIGDKIRTTVAPPEGTPT